MKKILLLALLLAASPAFAATAMFTGRSEMVQSATYQMVWKCEYRYMGNNYYFLFKSSCPSSVEIE